MLIGLAPCLLFCDWLGTAFSLRRMKHRVSEAMDDFPLGLECGNASRGDISVACPALEKQMGVL